MANLGAFSLLLVAALWIWYTTRQGKLVTHNKGVGAKGTPSTFPCIFPRLGSLPIVYLWKPRDFVSDPK